jgi:hypothetical protein
VLKFLVVVVLFALAVYLVARTVQRRGVAKPSRPRHQPPPRPMGPDDDPDFLRDLDRHRRHPEDPDSPV